MALCLALFAVHGARSTVHAFGSDQVGTSGAEFLKIGPGARPVGMGSAFTGVADDIHAIYWNPAGLATLKNPELTGMHMDYFQSIQYEFAAFAYPTQAHGTWGFAVTDLHTNNIDARTEDTDAPTGQFSAIENAYWVSYANHLTDRLSLGGNLKFIRQSINATHANAYALDGGLLYDTSWHEVRLGAAAQNLGTQVKFASDSDPLPMTFRLGGSAPFLEHKLLLSSDLVIPRDNHPNLDLGGEYKHPIGRGMVASMQTGYQTGSTVSGLSGVSVGGGLEVGRANFDFAWVPFGDLGNSYRLAIHLKFGRPEDKNLSNSSTPLKQASVPADHDSAALEQLLSL